MIAQSHKIGILVQTNTCNDSNQIVYEHPEGLVFYFLTEFYVYLNPSPDFPEEKLGIADRPGGDFCLVLGNWNVTEFFQVIPAIRISTGDIRAKLARYSNLRILKVLHSGGVGYFHCTTKELEDFLEVRRG